MDIENRQCIGAVTDGDRVLYLVQFLLDTKAKFIPQVNCRSLINKEVITSKLTLDPLRVLGIILRGTLFRFS